MESYANADEPTLVEIDEEDHVVAEAGNAVGERHLDNEGEHVINESVECLQCEKWRWRSEGWRRWRRGGEQFNGHEIK